MSSCGFNIAISRLSLPDHQQGQDSSTRSVLGHDGCDLGTQQTPPSTPAQRSGSEDAVAPSTSTSALSENPNGMSFFLLLLLSLDLSLYRIIQQPSANSLVSLLFDRKTSSKRACTVCGEQSGGSWSKLPTTAEEGPIQQGDRQYQEAQVNSNIPLCELPNYTHLCYACMSPILLSRAKKGSGNLQTLGTYVRTKALEHLWECQAHAKREAGKCKAVIKSDKALLVHLQSAVDLQKYLR